ncbi:circumsporozoite protein-like [Teleopsis dalmanni]|uniref:circumsporozoite protein-like n=1 Tax=Teleopsis dalmanni TaxID=139649 RepID=UPI0018CFAB30|nr:circumsporozoite protein-like [Teleopsis dalmanni]
MNYFFLLALLLAVCGTFADVSHLDTDLREDGYHYKEPSIPFPPPPTGNGLEDTDFRPRPPGPQPQPQPQPQPPAPAPSYGPPQPQPSPQPQYIAQIFKIVRIDA